MRTIYDRIADWLIRRAQRTPYIHLEGYLNRWWLVPYNRFGIAARVHQILRSDEDRHLHNHPWPYISIVLRGGYWEVTPATIGKLNGGGTYWIENRRWRGPGSIAFRRASSWHRIEVPDGGDCWTLFITGPKRRDHDPQHSSWGFLVDGRKVPADVYLGERYIDTDYRGAA